MAKIFRRALIFAFLVSLPTISHAASMSFSPAVGDYSVGSSFQVSVYVSSSDLAMNAASGVISFPPDKLAVVSVSKADSVFTLWVQEPTFSNAAGTVNFEGIVLNPGYLGSRGKIITVNFKTIAVGAAPLSITSGSVLANDGSGTNILTSLSSASFGVGYAADPVPVSTTPAAALGTPAAPQIYSPTHPDPTSWYAKNNATFTWGVTPDITASRVLVGKNPRSVPTVVYTPATSGKELTNIADGVWYFSVQLRNASGWGEISHFRFQIDTGKPSKFEITEIPRTDPTDPRALFTFDAKDSSSGIDHYELQVDQGAMETWKDNGKHQYQAPAAGPGRHTLNAKAVDKAGNALLTQKDFTVTGLNAPIITDYPRVLQTGESFVARGTSTPGSEVTITLKNVRGEAKTYKVKTDIEGRFVYVAEENPGSGTYELQALATDERGAQSVQSEKNIVLVESPPIIRFGAIATSYLVVLVPLVALVFMLAFIVWYGWQKFAALRKRLHKDVHEAESAVSKGFDVMREHINRQVGMLEKAGTERKLTDEESRIIHELKRDLNDAEKYIKREIGEIEREIK